MLRFGLHEGIVQWHRMLIMCCFAAAAEEHRELCRKHLRLVLEAGYNPMRFFASDFKKYFYLAELYSLIDLSSVQPVEHICSLADVVLTSMYACMLQACCVD